MFFNTVLYKESWNAKVMNKHMILLQVIDGYTRDIGKGIARIDFDAMDSIGARNWDVIEIQGKKTTFARCLPLYPEDDGKKILRTDKLVHNNAEISEGDFVKIRKVRKMMARCITISPLESIPPVTERYLRDALEGVPITKKDKMSLPYFDQKLLFDVVDVKPNTGGIIDRKTAFYIKNEKHIARIKDQ